MMTALQLLQLELETLVLEKRDREEIKLLSYGTESCHEYHWRFQTPDGRTIILKVEEQL